MRLNYIFDRKRNLIALVYKTIFNVYLPINYMYNHHQLLKFFIYGVMHDNTQKEIVLNHKLIQSYVKLFTLNACITGRLLNS